LTVGSASATLAAVTEELVKQELRDYIVRSVGLAAAPGDHDRLVENGFVPSVRMLDLVGFLEDTFAIRLRPVDLIPEKLATIQQIAQIVQDRLTSKR
jgi:acyl carrier protein